MLIQPLRNNPGRRRVAQALARPAPVGGWNARDAIADMDPTDAIQLDNWFPGTDSINLRPGSVRYSTGVGTGVVDSLISYSSGATSKLLSCGNSAIYDSSTDGAVGAALASGFTSNRWQDINFKGYSLLFNGADTPQKFDGSAISSNSITGSGLTSTNLIYPWIFKERVFIIEKNTLNAWYLGTAAISGTATKLDFSSLCALGGKLVFGATWSRDGGSGADDICVFGTDKGEVLVYQGTDPASASTWSLAGVFRIGAPVGQRPVFKVGADLVVITIDGFVPISRVLPVDRVGAESASISDKIRDVVNHATRLYKDSFGWQAIHYPNANWGVFNIPISEGGEAHQYVLNTITGAWCRFKGMNANCWAVFNDNLYFGGNNGVIYKADDNIGDDTGEGATVARADTVADVKTAYDYQGMRTRQKRYTQVRPLIGSDGIPDIELAFNVDFSDNDLGTVTATDPGGAEWDEEDWDDAYWSSGLITQKNWYSVSGLGYASSLYMRIASNIINVSFTGYNIQFEPAGLM